MLSPSMEYEDFEIDEDYIDYYSEDEDSKGMQDARHDDDNGDDDDDEGDNDEDEIGIKAFAYDPSQLSNSSGMPVNGHDFLKMVQEERKRLPSIVSVAPPPPKISSTSQLLVTENELAQGQSHAMEFHCEEQSILVAVAQNNCHNQQSKLKTKRRISNSFPVDSDTDTDSSDDNDKSVLSYNNRLISMAPSQEFRNQIRLKSLGCTPLQINKNPNVQSTSTSQQTAPPSQPRDLIHRDEILTNFIKLRNKIEDMRGQTISKPEAVPDEIDTNEKTIEKNISRSKRRADALIRIMNLGHPPQVNLLMHKSQLVIHSILDKLAEQSENAPIYSTLHADWIYSLIAVLREPIEPDIYATLRRLAKLCCSRRDSFEKRSSSVDQTNQVNSDEARALVNAIDEEEYYACLLIICIVKYHFGQADLK